MAQQTNHIGDTNKMVTINKEFIPYEQALELKQLGFKEDCLGEWQNLKLGKNLVVDEEVDRVFDVPVLGADIRAPLYQQAFRWFREKHGLSAQFSYYHVAKWTFEILEFTDIKITPNKVVWEHSKERTYEEAELACLKKLIEIVKNK